MISATKEDFALYNLCMKAEATKIHTTTSTGYVECQWSLWRLDPGHEINGANYMLEKRVTGWMSDKPPVLHWFTIGTLPELQEAFPEFVPNDLPVTT